ncbi:ADAMTS10 [Symbiodinium sp. CCMP2456]|nr:ADAMTS10 [Symbiodinium sp. CCMP2456]
MNDYNQSFSRLRLTSLGDQELHRNQEIARESSRQLTVLLAEGTKQFDQKQLQMVKVGKDGPGQEFRTNLAAFSKFLSKFWETKWLDGLVAPEFAEQKDLAVQLMNDLQKQKNLCPDCRVSYFGTYCMTCNRCPCGYYAHQGVCCGHFGAGCQRCGAAAFQQGTFCESCGYCVHGRHQSVRTAKRRGCECQTTKQPKTAKTCKTALGSDQNKPDHEATSREQLTELANMADALAKLCRKDAKVMETAEKEFQKKMVLLKGFAEAINDVPKVLRCFLLFRCGAIKEDPTSLKEWLSKAEVEEVHRQLEEFRDEAGEEKIARRFGKSRTVSEGSWSVMTDLHGVVR